MFMLIVKWTNAMKWLGLPLGEGGDSSWFTIVCHYVMKLYERFQMELMVSFDEMKSKTI